VLYFSFPVAGYQTRIENAVTLQKYNSEAHCNDSVKKKADALGVGFSFFAIIFGVAQTAQHCKGN